MGLYSIAVLLQRLIDIYGWVIVIWCILSWVPRTGSGLFEDIRGALGMLVEPYLGLFRRFIPPVMGVDFSPIVAILALSLIERLLDVCWCDCHLVPFRFAGRGLSRVSVPYQSIK